MELSADLTKAFADTVNPNGDEITDVTVYGTAVIDNGIYVRLDGGTVLSPATTTVGVKNGDRVVVLLKDRTAVITGNATSPTGTLTAEQVNQMILARDMNIYRVGSYYFSNDPTNPATIFGFGLWTQVQNRFLVGAGTGYNVGDTGGTASNVLGVGNLPPHNHDYANGYKLPYLQNGQFPYGASKLIAAQGTYAYFIGMSANNVSMDVPATVGSGSPVNNLPPYYATYIWRRYQ